MNHLFTLFPDAKKNEKKVLPIPVSKVYKENDEDFALEGNKFYKSFPFYSKSIKAPKQR